MVESPDDLGCFERHCDPSPSPGAADGQHVVLGETSCAIAPAELPVPDDLAFVNGGKRRLGDEPRASEVQCRELVERTGAHRNVTVVGDVGHRLRGRLPNPSGKLRPLGERHDGDVLRQLDRRARAAVEAQAQPAGSIHDDKAVALGECDTAGVIHEAEQLELRLAERASMR